MGMSLLAQIVLGLVVAGGIGFGVWNHKQHSEERRMDDRAHMQAEVQLTTGTTNADLDADLRSIDSQLDSVNSASADAALDDKPIQE